MEEKKNLEPSLKLRPHHVIGYIMYEANPGIYSLSGEEYIARFREQRGDFHSDQLILHWRNMIKQLHDNPNLKFIYVESVDSVCERCEHIRECHDSAHENFRIVEQADRKSAKSLSQLRFGEVYDGNHLKHLFMNEGWLELVLS